jgi:nitrate reductase gamma subunit
MSDGSSLSAVDSSHEGVVMYDFVRGPLVWIAFIGFFGGLIYQFVATALLAKKDRVVYATYDARYGVRSLAHWLVPFAGRSTRMHPVYTIVSFAFHICVIVTPLFVMGHAVLWQESWGIRWWSLPATTADLMTLVVIVACLLFIVRRLVLPQVRFVTDRGDYLLALLVMAPFLTGFLAHRQWLPYKPMLIAHIVSGAACLLLIPWTRLVHMIWFAFTRAYMGSEFGSVRHARDW